MGRLLTYANDKDKLDRDISEEVTRLYLEGLSYQMALKKAKKIYLGRNNKKWRNLIML